MILNRYKIITAYMELQVLYTFNLFMPPEVGDILDSARLSVHRSVRPSSVFCFLDIFWINLSDIEMKIGMNVYNNELQIKFEFHHY
jgi:hypothetical protein